uniref:RING-type domain-containing protein n=1 Tax=Setaria italica TaxID=4555 RepID=K4AIK7_SETIT
MPSPATDDEATGVTIEEEFGEKGHGGARSSAGTAAAAAAAEEDRGEARPPAGPTCCICMEPWTCNDAHRSCCIPCGHVYGRSCLERWLHRCGESSAKCPRCGEQFAQKHIINLYAQGNLWDAIKHLR